MPPPSFAIIDCHGPDPDFFHDSYRAFSVRSRLDQAHGHHNNHIIWEGPLVIIGDVDCTRQFWRWLGSVWV
ncbi:MAG: DUF6351 family protein [Venatoribacter sp.]